MRADGQSGGRGRGKGRLKPQWRAMLAARGLLQPLVTAGSPLSPSLVDRGEAVSRQSAPVDARVDGLVRDNLAELLLGLVEREREELRETRELDPRIVAACLAGPAA